MLALRLSHRLGLSTLAVISGFVLLLMMNLNGYWKGYRGGIFLNEAVELALALDQISHQHAVERGLSAGFLGSGGKQQVKLLQDQRDQAEMASERLEQLSRQPSRVMAEELRDRATQPVLSLLSSRSAVRRGVDSLTNHPDSFEYYSRLNASALNSIALLTANIENQAVTTRMSFLMQLLWMAERLGQERGALNGVFSAGRASIDQYAAILGYAEEQRQLLDALRQQGTPEQLDTLMEVMDGDVARQVRRYEQDFFAQRHSLQNIQGPEASRWFELATALIKQIKAITSAEAMQLQQQAAQLQHQSRQALWGMASFGGLLLLLVLWLQWKVVRRLKSGVFGLNKHLGDIVREQDLTREVKVVGNDELSEIGRAFNTLREHLRSTLNKVSEVAYEVDQRSRKALGLSTDSQEQLQQQRIETDALAVAINEMSQTAADVASHAAITAEIAQDIRLTSEQARKDSRKVQEHVTDLDRQLNTSRDAVVALADKIRAINTIVATIDAISEQINLLALNASIEAARAGESGRGFAVVADEVRNLAQKTRQATIQINSNIMELQDTSNHAMGQMEQSLNVTRESVTAFGKNDIHLKKVFDDVGKAVDAIAEIASAAEEQSNVSQTLNSNIQRIVLLSEDNHQGSQTVERCSAELEQLAGALVQQIGLFRYK